MSFNLNTIILCVVAGILLTLGATVCTYIFVLPEGKIKAKGFFGKVFASVRDIFTFKELFIDKILQALYILATLGCILVGFMLLFGFRCYDSFWSGFSVTWTGGWGLLLMFVGPIAVRIAFEIIMMFVLLVKNVMQINGKLSAEANKTADDKVAVAAEPVADEAVNNDNTIE